MPFTLSHAVAVLPALRRDGAARGPLVASGLVFGTFAPDVPYFFGLWDLGTIAHGPLGVLVFDPAIAVLLLLAWWVVGTPIAALLPASWRARAAVLLPRRPPPSRGGLPFEVAFWGSAAIGSATHVLVDAFTHNGRWGVLALPVLREEVVAGQPLFTVLQYGLSAVGTLACGIYLIVLLRRARPAEDGPRSPELPAAVRFAVVGLLVAFAAVPSFGVFEEHPGSVLGLMQPAAFAAGAGLGLGLLVYASIIRLFWFARTR